MSILRFDPTTSDWVILAPLRGLRPHETAKKVEGAAEGSPTVPVNCPFCPGNEVLTPPEIYSVPGTGRFTLASASNR